MHKHIALLATLAACTPSPPPCQPPIWDVSNHTAAAVQVEIWYYDDIDSPWDSYDRTLGWVAGGASDSFQAEAAYREIKIVDDGGNPVPFTEDGSSTAILGDAGAWQCGTRTRFTVGP
jgi:hypothetical protein